MDVDRPGVKVLGLVLMAAVGVALFVVAGPGSLPDAGVIPVDTGEFGSGERSTADPAPTLTPVPTAEPPGTVTPEPEPAGNRFARNPWERERIVVAVEDRAGTDRPFVLAVRSAVDYWEANPGQAAYPFDFVLRPNATDPDVVVRYADAVDCGDHRDSKGCAPLLSADADPPDPAVVGIEANERSNFRADRAAVVHELGHVLGLAHCDEPRSVMGAGCPGGADLPDADERETAWRDDTLRIYLDYGDVEANRSLVRRQVRLALASYAAGGNGTVPESLTFRRVADPYLADITVRLGVADGCGDGAQVCAGFAGSDLDGDGAAEFYTRGNVTLPPMEPRILGWTLGRWLGKTITPDGVPERYESRPADGPWWAGIPGTAANESEGRFVAPDRATRVPSGPRPGAGCRPPP